MRSDDEVEALREAHRMASDRIGERPDASVRAAVLAAAARGVDARPQPAATVTPASTPSGRGPFQMRRWPLSAAALLVVSVMTGVIATRAVRDRPERITTAASSAPNPLTLAPDAPAADSATKTAAASPAATTDRGPGGQPPPVVEPARPKTANNEARRHVPVRSVEREASAPPQAAPPPATPAPATPAPGAAAAAPSPEAPPPARAKAEATASSNQSANAQDVSSGSASARVAETGALLRAATAPSAARTRIGRAPEPATPEAWVARIVKLRADGNDDEADRELDALRQRYPGFEIPAAAQTQR